MTGPRLRDRPITEKPRVTKSRFSRHIYWVEATVNGWNYCTLAHSFPEAITNAVDLARQIKEEATP